MSNSYFKHTFLKCIACWLFLYPTLPCPAQSSANITLHKDVMDLYDSYINRLANNVHTSIKPYLEQEVHLWKDSIQPFLYPSLGRSAKIVEKLNAGTFHILPIVTLMPGYDFSAKQPIAELVGGIGFNATIHNKLTIAINALAGNANFDSYTNNYVDNKHIVPVYGKAYPSRLGYSFQALSGYLSYSPNTIFNFQLGKDKHFIGDGYRSLFLSDVANTYPYFRIAANVWKVKYISLFTINKDITQPLPYQSKYAAFHYLSYNVTSRINVGLFESIVWQGSDTNRVRGFDVNYLNPVIFYRPVEYALGSSDNAFIGFSFKIKCCTYFQTYGQLLVDEFYLQEILARKGWWANKQGGQIGARFFDLFKINHLDLRTELNYVRPYTYSHGTSKQNYGHFNTPLAHPLGANFIEGIGVLSYRYQNWLISSKATLATYGADSAGYNMGNNIYASYTTRLRDYNNYTTQGIKTRLVTADVKLAYLLSIWNTELTAGITFHKQSSTLGTVMGNYIYIGIKTLLFNDYRDF